MNKTEKMPERPNYRDFRDTHIFDRETNYSIAFKKYVEDLESFCNKKAEMIKYLDDQRSVFASEQSRQQRVIISLRSKIKLLEEDNDILRDDASKKLLDYLTMRNKAERLEEEKRELLKLLKRIRNYNSNPACDNGSDISAEVNSFLSTKEKGETEK